MIDLSWDETGVRSLFYLAMFLLIVAGVDKLRSIKTHLRWIKVKRSPLSSLVLLIPANCQLSWCWPPLLNISRKLYCGSYQNISLCHHRHVFNEGNVEILAGRIGLPEFWSLNFIPDKIWLYYHHHYLLFCLMRDDGCSSPW